MNNLNFLQASNVSFLFIISKSFIWEINLFFKIFRVGNPCFPVGQKFCLSGRGLFIITFVRRSSTFGYGDIAFQAKWLRYKQKP
jgi:hypothetical protein